MQRLEKVKDGKGEEGKRKRKGGTPEKPGSRKEAKETTVKPRKKKNIVAPPEQGQSAEVKSAGDPGAIFFSMANDTKCTGTECLLRTAQIVIIWWQRITGCLCLGDTEGVQRYFPNYREAQLAFHDELTVRMNDRVIPPVGNPEREQVLVTLMDAASASCCWMPKFTEFITNNNATDQEIREYMARHLGWAIKMEDGRITAVFQIHYMFSTLFREYEKEMKRRDQIRSMMTENPFGELFNFSSEMLERL